MKRIRLDDMATQSFGAGITRSHSKATTPS
jgi:hypothetical protein